MDIWGKSLSGRGNGMGKGQEVAKSLVNFRNSKEVRGVRAWRVREKGRCGQRDGRAR